MLPVSLRAKVSHRPGGRDSYMGRRMDLCFGLFGFGLLLFVLAAIGHGLWIFGRLIFGSFTAAEYDPLAAPLVPPRTQCPRCRTHSSTSSRYCPACGLDRTGQTAHELLDLEASARSLQILVDRAALDAETAERLYLAIEARQHE